MNGVSKAYCMTGWRIGFAGGPADLIKAMAKVQSQSTSNPSSVSQAAAVEALERPPGLHSRPQRGLQGAPRHGGGHAEPVRRAPVSPPEGAFYVYPSCAGAIGKTTPGGKTIETDDGFRHLPAGGRRAWPRCRARLSACRPTSASPTPPRPRPSSRLARASRRPARR